MCVLIHQPVGERLVRKDAEKLWRQNPDGGGFAYIHNGKPVIRKSMDFKTFWREYQGARTKHPKSPFLIHMRIGTHGSVSLDNTHPFVVNETTVMAHNGVLWECTPKAGDDRSDTRVFVEEFLPELPNDWLDSLWVWSMVEDFIGGDKMMFLTTDPKLERTVYRLGQFTQRKGLWLSNTYGLDTQKYAIGKWNRKTTSYGWSESGLDSWYDEDDEYGAWWREQDREEEDWLDLLASGDWDETEITTLPLKVGSVSIHDQVELEDEHK